MKNNFVLSLLTIFLFNQCMTCYESESAYHNYKIYVDSLESVYSENTMLEIMNNIENDTMIIDNKFSDLNQDNRFINYTLIIYKDDKKLIINGYNVETLDWLNNGTGFSRECLEHYQEEDENGFYSRAYGIEVEKDNCNVDGQQFDKLFFITTVTDFPSGISRTLTFVSKPN